MPRLANGNSRISRVLYHAASLGFGFVIALSSTSYAAGVLRTWNGNGGNNRWETAGNWTPNGVPAAEDTVRIPGDKGTIVTNGEEKKVLSFRMLASANEGGTTLTARTSDGRLHISTSGPEGIGDIVIEARSHVQGWDSPGGMESKQGRDAALTCTNGGRVQIFGTIRGGHGASEGNGGGAAIGGEVVIVQQGGNLLGGDGGNAPANKRAGDGGTAALLAPRANIQGTMRGGKGGDSGNPGRGGEGGKIAFWTTGQDPSTVTGVISGGTGGKGTEAAGQEFRPGDGGGIEFVFPSVVDVKGTVTGGTGGDNLVATKAGGGGGSLSARQNVKLRVFKPAGKLEGGPGGGPKVAGKKGGFTDDEKFEVKKEEGLMAGNVPAVEARFFHLYASSDSAAVILADLDEIAIRVETSVVLHLCQDCVVDLRGNDSGINIIEAPEGICIYGQVLTDPGVSIADLTEPDAQVFTDSLAAVLCERSLVEVEIQIETPQRESPVKLSVQNPSRRATALAYELEVPSPGYQLRIDLLDPTGRRILELHRGWFEPGKQHGRWDEARLGSLPAGLYFVRAIAECGDAVQKVVLLE